MKETKNNLVRKIVVFAISLVLVCGIAAGAAAILDKKEEARLEQLLAEEEAAKEAAKPAMSEEEIHALYEEHKLTVGKETESTGAESTGAESTAESREEVYTAPVDFEGMQKVNGDVYAWIKVPGTVVDYPILQHPTDNTYYLNYNIDGSYGYPGCIYTENMNSKDFTDNNTVIYGHNMKNGTMFGGLHAYEDMSFLEENDKVYIYTPEKEYEYTIFAAYVYDDRHLLYSFDFANEDVYAAYLEDIQEMRDMSANIRNDITVTKEDKIITLVTCMAKQPEKRLLVQAVQVK